MCLKKSIHINYYFLQFVCRLVTENKLAGENYSMMKIMRNQLSSKRYYILNYEHMMYRYWLWHFPTNCDMNVGC